MKTLWVLLVIIYQGEIGNSAIKGPDIATDRVFETKEACDSYAKRQSWQTQHACAKLTPRFSDDPVIDQRRCWSPQPEIGGHYYDCMVVR